MCGLIDLLGFWNGGDEMKKRLIESSQMFTFMGYGPHMSTVLAQTQNEYY